MLVWLRYDGKSEKPVDLTLFQSVDWSVIPRETELVTLRESLEAEHVCRVTAVEHTICVDGDRFPPLVYLVHVSTRKP